MTVVQGQWLDTHDRDLEARQARRSVHRFSRPARRDLRARHVHRRADLEHRSAHAARSRRAAQPGGRDRSPDPRASSWACSRPRSRSPTRCCGAADTDVIQCGFAFPTLDDYPSLVFAAVMEELRPPHAPHGGRVAVVAPAGNEQSTRKFWPAAHPEVIGVASTNRRGNGRAWFSNWGRLVRLLRPRRVRLLDLRALGWPGRGRVARRDRALPRMGEVGRNIVRRAEGVGGDRRRVRRPATARRLPRTSRSELIADGREQSRRRHRRDPVRASRRAPALPAHSIGVGIIATTPSLEALIRAANDGDDAAWGAIVDRFAGLVWATARAHRLAPAEAADVAQTTWLRLVENLDRINDPERLGAWLATTARRECLRHIRLQSRELPTGEDALFEAPSDDRAEQRLITRERNAAVRRAFREDQRALPGAAAPAGGAPGASATRRSPRRSACRSARSARPAPAAWISFDAPRSSPGSRSDSRGP